MKSRALVSQLSYTVQNTFYMLLSDGVMSTSVVICGVFLSRDKIGRVKKLLIGSGTNFVNYRWFKVDKDSTWDILSSIGFSEEGGEGVII